MRKDWIVAALSLVCLVALWALASAVKADPLVLPSPRATLTVWAELAARGELWIQMRATLIRVAIAFTLAMGLGSVAQVITTLRDGTRATNPDHDDMAQVFGMSRMAHLRHVLLPQLAPFFAVAARNGLAMIWKIVLVVEFLGRCW
eukprot:g15189.t1